VTQRPFEPREFAAPPERRKVKTYAAPGTAPEGRATKPKRRGLRLIPLIGMLVVGGTLSGLGYGAWHFFGDLPQVPATASLWSVNRTPGMTFLDHDGALIATRGARNGYRVRLTELQPYTPKAFLAAEDRRFYQHGPVDFRGMARALRANYDSGQVVQGGSTLTQQIAKTLFLKPDRTIKRKLQEAVLAYQLERAMTKDEVFELYLNRIYFGAASYGLDAAAETYFGKPARQLTLAESALLAALPKAPSRLALDRDFDAALERSHIVLSRMRQEGWITAADQALALAQRPALAPERAGEGVFGYVLDLASAEAVQRAGSQAPDLVIRLSIDPTLQEAAQKTVQDTIAGDGRRAGARQAALVSLATDGRILALVGGTDHRRSPFNRAVQARRQPGSAYKPLVYAAALEAGVGRYDVRTDAPVRYGSWRPANYGGGYSGAVTVEDALARSINTVAVKLGAEVGRAKLGEIAHRFGLSTIPDEPNLSVTLGAYEVSVLELSSAFQVFQNGGGRVTPYLIEAITSSRGDVLYARAASAPTPVYDQALAGSMVRMMRRVVTSGTATRAQFGRPAAGKTGTSQDWRDAWFIGFTPDILTGVWVGNDDNRSMNRVTGGALPADIWRRFMTVAHKDIPEHDFDWLPEEIDLGPPPEAAELFPEAEDATYTPPEPPPPERAPREDFYDTLAADFGEAAEGGGDRSPPRDMGLR